DSFPVDPGDRRPRGAVSAQGQDGALRRLGAPQSRAPTSRPGRPFHRGDRRARPIRRRALHLLPVLGGAMAEGSIPRPHVYKRPTEVVAGARPTSLKRVALTVVIAALVLLVFGSKALLT